MPPAPRIGKPARSLPRISFIAVGYLPAPGQCGESAWQPRQQGVAREIVRLKKHDRNIDVQLDQTRKTPKSLRVVVTKGDRAGTVAVLAELQAQRAEVRQVEETEVAQ